MKYVVLAAGMILAYSTGAQAQGNPNSCIDFFKFVWGYDASTNGRVKAGGSCRTSFEYRGSKTTDARVVQAPAHGKVAVQMVGDGRARFIYTPAKGYTGQDVFTVEIKGVTISRTGAERPEAATKITYNFTVSP